MNHIIENKYKSLLDIGAGVYDEFYRFKKNNYPIDYQATEITDKFLDYGFSKDINVCYSNLEELPFPDESFDVVICYDVLNHQKSFRAGLKEIIRVTKYEAIVSFFKPFAEEEDAKKELERCKNKFNFSNQDGICLVREKDKSKNTICIYSFFYINKIKAFLNENTNVEYQFFKIKSSNFVKENKVITICRINKINNSSHNFFFFSKKNKFSLKSIKKFIKKFFKR